MKPDASHIRQIKVVSNTHWDREFRQSFEKTRRGLLTMMDTTLDILERDPEYHSFTLDGHAILLDDYLEMRPERRELVSRLIQQGRLIAGPYYTLAEAFSISQEAIVRNLMWGRKTIEKYGGRPGTVAYTPSSWGQTGQLPQILRDFGQEKMMFYRGISHHEADAEYLWRAPDGSTVLASRFAIYARYNWYYLVHRAVTRGRVFEKDYQWGEYDEMPYKPADSLYPEDPSFDLKSPAVHYQKEALTQAIETMVRKEGPHFTTEVFLAMHGHDISVAHPLESRVIRDAQEALGDRYAIQHTSLEAYWAELEKHLNTETMTVLTGERRAYLKEGMWTFLFPGTLSARTYLKQQDFAASHGLTHFAEPLAALATSRGMLWPSGYLSRGWQYLLSNHTHDANGGCAPDAVCKDMEYRYRKATDISDIVSGDAMAYLAGNLSPEGLPADAMQLVVYNALPVERDALVCVDLEIPRQLSGKSVCLVSPQDPDVPVQPVSSEKSSVFVDSIWDVPTIMDTQHVRLHSRFTRLPALGYRTYRVLAAAHEPRHPDTLVTGPDTLENRFLRVRVNGNGTLDVLNKTTGKRYTSLNYLSDQGECGNAWKHVAPVRDRKYSSLGVSASVSVTESGPLTSTLCAEYSFPVPADYGDGSGRSERLVHLPVRMTYTLEKDSTLIQVRCTLENTARDHWLRACMPTGIATSETLADSHFDVVSRPIPIPDSTGWAEPAGGTHPLRTFVSVSDSQDGFAVIPKGLFEYEAFDHATTTLALTLIRACRIKLAVSEEKMTELSDAGVQCPGAQTFEYALSVHEGDWQTSGLQTRAAGYLTPVRAAMTGRGKGHLPLQGSLFSIRNTTVQVTCVKQAEDGSGLIIRMYNPSCEPADTTLVMGQAVLGASLCRMDESHLSDLTPEGCSISLSVGPKKICTLKIT